MKETRQVSSDSAPYRGYRFEWLGESASVRIDGRLQCDAEIENLRRYFDVRNAPEMVAADITMTRRNADTESFPRSATDATAFALYFGEHGERRAGDGGSIIVDAKRQRTIAFAADGIEYSFWTGNADDRWMIGRLLREKLVQRVLARGGLRLHAGLVGNAGRGILVLGASGSGKSALLLHLLRLPDATFAGADRVVVRNAGAPTGHGVPITAQMGVDLVDSIPGLSEQVTAAQSRHFPRSPRATPDAFAKYSLLPGELIEALQVPLTPTLPIDLVVVPNLGERRGTAPSTRPIGETERAMILATETLHPDPAFPAAVVGEAESDYSRPARAGLLAVPWIGVSGDYRDPRIAHAALTELLGEVDHV